MLILGYLLYSRFVARVVGADPNRKTPAMRLEDGVDYVPLPAWKVYMIQFLNIAGLGPIFGAVTGAAFGPMAYLWIVFGNILLGATYDYCSGMLSIRNDGASIPTLVGRHLGIHVKRIMTVLTVFLLLSVAGSFISGPAGLLAVQTGWSPMWWSLIVFGYYILATLVPIDKIIGRIYPVFGFFLLFMAVSLAVVMISKTVGGSLVMPELTASSFHNFHRNPGVNVIFPMMFIVISCGAMSGFHATQSPMMARCIKNEKYARPVFYGAMISEGIVALIWANAAIAYMGGPEALNQAYAAGATPAILVDKICRSWLGKVGGIIAVIGVIACPITSGDTALRSLRLIVAEAFKVDQKKLMRRLLVSLPVFAAAYLLCMLDFDIVWRLLGIFNQSLGVIILWAMAEALKQRSKHTWVLAVPATFLSFICFSYVLIAPHVGGGLALNHTLGYCIAAVLTLFLDYLFYTNKIVEWNKNAIRK